MSFDKSEHMEKLDKLLARREKYFMLQGFQRLLYVPEFEKLQSEIIKLKLLLDIWQDELDLFSVVLDYTDSSMREKFLIMENAELAREVKWVRKSYSPRDKLCEYIGMIGENRFILDNWLRDIWERHLLKRQGLITCPWPVKLGQECLKSSD